MAVISISFINSDIEILNGIPKTVSIETSIPATVFYTLDRFRSNIFFLNIYFGNNFASSTRSYFKMFCIKSVL